MTKRSRQRKSAQAESKQAKLWQPSLRLCAALLLAVIAIFAIVRFRLRDAPLERDEGEYAYAGQLILQGIPPYQLAYNMKLPGTYAAYAIIMGVLGQTAAGIHLGVLLISAGTIVLMYFLGAKLFGRIAGLAAGASYGLLSTSASVQGLFGHATHFVVFPAVGGLLVLLDAIDHKRVWLFFVSGLLLGLPFLMKQPGIFFAIFAALYLLWKEWTRPVQLKTLSSRLGLFALGVVIPYGLTCLILWRAGVFGKVLVLDLLLCTALWCRLRRWPQGLARRVPFGGRTFRSRLVDSSGGAYSFLVGYQSPPGQRVLLGISGLFFPGCLSWIPFYAALLHFAVARSFAAGFRGGEFRNLRSGGAQQVCASENCPQCGIPGRVHDFTSGAARASV